MNLLKYIVYTLVALIVVVTVSPVICMIRLFEKPVRGEMVVDVDDEVKEI